MPENTNPGQDVVARLDRIEGNQNVIATMTRIGTQLETKMNEMCERTERIELAVHGAQDGRTGLTARVTELERATSERATSITARASVIVGVLMALAAAVSAVVAVRSVAPPAPIHAPRSQE